MQQACPILSIATVELPKPGALLVGDQKKPPEPQFVPCLGKSCALFCPVHDAQGNVVGGGCALALMPQALMAVNNTLLNATESGEQFPEEEKH